MKRFAYTFLALSVLLAPSCEKADFHLSKDREIIFSTGKSTRSYTSATNASLQADGFNVAAVTENNPNMPLFNQAVTYIADEGIFRVADEHFFFPNNGTTSFFAAYPTTQDISLNADGTAYLSYAHDPDIDLIVARKQNVATQEAAVELNFEHILSQVTVQCKGLNDKILYKLYSLSLTTMNGGTYMYADNEWSMDDTSEKYNIYDNIEGMTISTSDMQNVGESMSFLPGPARLNIVWKCYNKNVPSSEVIYQDNVTFDVTLTRGKHTTFNVSLPASPSEVIFTSNVEDWSSDTQQFTAVSNLPPEPLRFEADHPQEIWIDKNYWTDYPEQCHANMEYSFDKVNWITWEFSEYEYESEPLTFGTMEHPCVYVRGNNPEGLGYISLYDDKVYGEGPTFVFGNSDIGVKCTGNIMSLIDHDVCLNEIPADGCFAYLFIDAPLTSAPELPATKLAKACYEYMFYDCYNLTVAPELPATELAESCYKYMFCDCYNLTAAPELPATELAENCYEYMFCDCKNLTAAPELPATKLAESCYKYMFYGCENLMVAPELPATELAESCYEYMFANCYNLTAAPELPATELAKACYEYMFYDCYNLTVAPELPATKLAESCYKYMFCDCYNLTAAPELPATELAENCYEYMFCDCKNLTAAPELPATKLAESCYKYMFYGCYNLKSVTMKATNVSAIDALSGWLFEAGNDAPYRYLYVDPTMVSDHTIYATSYLFTVLPIPSL